MLMNKVMKLSKLVKNDKDPNSIWSDYGYPTIAKLFLETFKLFKKYMPEGYSDWNASNSDDYYEDISKIFGLDIGANGNHFHTLFWEQWLSKLHDWEFIQIQTRWTWPSDVWVSDQEIAYLQHIVDNNLFELPEEYE